MRTVMLNEELEDGSRLLEALFIVGCSSGLSSYSQAAGDSRSLASYCQTVALRGPALQRVPGRLPR